MPKTREVYCSRVTHRKTFAYESDKTITLFPYPLVLERTSLAYLRRLGPHSLLELLRSHRRPLALVRQCLPYPGFMRALHGYLCTLRREDV